VPLVVYSILSWETLIGDLGNFTARLTPLRSQGKRLHLNRMVYRVSMIQWSQRLNVPFSLPAIICDTQKKTQTSFLSRLHHHADTEWYCFIPYFSIN
jgi:hypothetical protein